MKGNEQSLELLVRGHDKQIKLLRTMVTESNTNTRFDRIISISGLLL